MNKERINPLDLPEIIMTIGRCLPLWKHSDNLGFYDYNPKLLLSCTLVSKTWRDALLPVIWYVYNGFVMRSIPKEIILKYSVHFRLLFGDRSVPGGLLSRHIKSLVISWWDMELFRLVEANAESLENLSWKGTVSSGGSSSSLVTNGWPSPDYGLLMRMAPTLKELHLSHWTLSGQEMARFLGACKRLHRLDLAAIDWVDPVPEYGQLLAASSAIPFSRPAATTGQGLTDLNLDISNPKDDAFVDLLRYCCPDLERLTLFSESASDPRRFTPLLRTHCPKLIGIDYVTRFSSSLDRRDYLADNEYADLVMALSDGVRAIKLDIPWLDTQLTRAIVLRPLTLQSLNLRFYERRMTPPSPSFSSSSSFSSGFSSPSSSQSLSSLSYSIKDAENLGQIVLQQCIHLRELSLFFNPLTMGHEETLKLVEKPWACLQLESLVLADVSIGLTQTSISTPWQGGSSGGIVEDMVMMSPSPYSSPSSPESGYGYGYGHGYGMGSPSSPSSDILPQFPQGPGLIQPYQWQVAAMSPRHGSPGLGGGGSGSGSQGPPRYAGSLAKQRLFDQVRRLPKLTRLSLNHVTYSLEGLSSANRPSQ
ncbi:hypothetical protein BGW39_007355 [Mortierella sp. 14UC]|nr:hypothetical protein BGW39_007355 [Mortierella sp. 14UC]